MPCLRVVLLAMVQSFFLAFLEGEIPPFILLTEPACHSNSYFVTNIRWVDPPRCGDSFRKSGGERAGEPLRIENRDSK